MSSIDKAADAEQRKRNKTKLESEFRQILKAFRSILLPHDSELFKDLGSTFNNISKPRFDRFFSIMNEVMGAVMGPGSAITYEEGENLTVVLNRFFKRVVESLAAHEGIFPGLANTNTKTPLAPNASVLPPAQWQALLQEVAQVPDEGYRMTVDESDNDEGEDLEINITRDVAFLVKFASRRGGKPGIPTGTGAAAPRRNWQLIDPSVATKHNPAKYMDGASLARCSAMCFALSRPGSFCDQLMARWRDQLAIENANSKAAGTARPVAPTPAKPAKAIDSPKAAKSPKAEAKESKAPALSKSKSMSSPRGQKRGRETGVTSAAENAQLGESKGKVARAASARRPTRMRRSGSLAASDLSADAVLLETAGKVRTSVPTARVHLEASGAEEEEMRLPSIRVKAARKDAPPRQDGPLPSQAQPPVQPVTSVTVVEAAAASQPTLAQFLASPTAWTNAYFSFTPADAYAVGLACSNIGVSSQVQGQMASAEQDLDVLAFGLSSTPFDLGRPSYGINLEGLTLPQSNTIRASCGMDLDLLFNWGSHTEVIPLLPESDNFLA